MNNELLKRLKAILVKEMKTHAKIAVEINICTEALESFLSGRKRTHNSTLYKIENFVEQKEAAYKEAAKAASPSSNPGRDIEDVS